MYQDVVLSGCGDTGKRQDVSYLYYPERFLFSTTGTCCQKPHVTVVRCCGWLHEILSPSLTDLMEIQIGGFYRETGRLQAILGYGKLTPPCCGVEHDMFKEFPTLQENTLSLLHSH